MKIKGAEKSSATDLNVVDYPIGFPQERQNAKPDHPKSPSPSALFACSGSCSGLMVIKPIHFVP